MKTLTITLVSVSVGNGKCDSPTYDIGLLNL
jgi:hypothetical protein